MGYYQNYCVECGWTASKEDHSTGELAALAIEHATSTGHDINSRRNFDGSNTGSMPKSRRGGRGESSGSAAGSVERHDS